MLLILCNECFSNQKEKGGEWKVKQEIAGSCKMLKTQLETLYTGRLMLTLFTEEPGGCGQHRSENTHLELRNDFGGLDVTTVASATIIAVNV